MFFLSIFAAETMIDSCFSSGCLTNQAEITPVEPDRVIPGRKGKRREDSPYLFLIKRAEKQQEICCFYKHFL